MKKIAVVAGGFSGEAAVSLRSASLVMNHIDRDEFEPYLVVISEKSWEVKIDDESSEIIDRRDFSFMLKGIKNSFDGVFVIVHGEPGENGILQAYFDLINLPYTTGSVWNMSMTFNKAACNNYLSSFGFKTAKNIRLKKKDLYSSSEIVAHLGLPLFVKPNNGGSSIGMTKVLVKEGIHEAVNLAFSVDDEVILEEFMEGVELTCGVIEREGHVYALPITEIVAHNEFFDYEAKYQGKSEEITPARIMEKSKNEVQRISKELYELLNCKGMIRVDFILIDEVPHIIEINTVPGFSEQSIIPQQAECDGISKKDLISMVIKSCF